MLAFTPGGKYRDSSSMRFFTAVAVATALAVGDSCTPMPVEFSDRRQGIGIDRQDGDVDAGEGRVERPPQHRAA